MKKQKEKITKEKNVRLFIVFERVLTSAQIAKLRQDAVEKKTLLKKKKKILRQENEKELRIKKKRR
jgi:hypothetical protein